MANLDSTKIYGNLVVTKDLQIIGNTSFTGNVGIGTSTPVAKLEVAGTIRTYSTTQTTYNDVLEIPKLYTSNVNWVNFFITTLAAHRIGIGYNDANHGLSIYSGTTGTTATSPGTLGFYQSTSGYIGVGTATPLSKLSILGNISAGLNTTDWGSSHAIQARANSNTDGILINRYSTTTNDYTGLYFSVTQAPGAASYAKGGILFNRTGAPGVGDLIFATNNAADATSVTTANARMVIKSDGNVGIGTTASVSPLQIGTTTNPIGAGANNTISFGMVSRYSTSAIRQYNVMGYYGTTVDATDIFSQTGAETGKNFFTGIVSDSGYFNLPRYSIIVNGIEKVIVTQNGGVGIGVNPSGYDGSLIVPIITTTGSPEETNQVLNWGQTSTYFSAIGHVHGNITNTGYLGTTANIPLITGTAGIIQAGSFGSAANTFCQGNDARLSDTRTPTDTSVTHAKLANNLKTAATVTSTVNLSANGIGNITLAANTAFTFTNYEINKTYMLVITANGFTPSWATSARHVPVEGNSTFGTTGVYYVSLTCIDATASAEKLLTVIMKGA